MASNQDLVICHHCHSHVRAGDAQASGCSGCRRHAGAPRRRRLGLRGGLLAASLFGLSALAGGGAASADPAAPAAEDVECDGELRVESGGSEDDGETPETLPDPLEIAKTPVIEMPPIKLPPTFDPRLDPTLIKVAPVSMYGVAPIELRPLSPPPGGLTTIPIPSPEEVPPSSEEPVEEAPPEE